MGKVTKDAGQLLPDRKIQGDLFVCDAIDAVPKGDMGSMEHPLFSLSTKPDTRPRFYGDPKGTYLQITPSVAGLATVHDRDVLIYVISQLVAALNDGRDIGQTVRFRAYDLLKATNRRTDGKAYRHLREALARLRGTTIETNIKSGGKKNWKIFGLVESAEIVSENGPRGRMEEVEVTLPQWVYEAVKAREVLTLNRDYFRLRKPLDRRMYELARKHCGQQVAWKISLARLAEKTGSGAKLFEFRRMVTQTVANDAKENYLPDYSITFDRDRDVVTFTNRGNVSAGAGVVIDVPPLQSETYDKARKKAPGWDIHKLEHEWRAWVSQTKREVPRKPDAAFVGFCASYAKEKSH